MAYSPPSSRSKYGDTDFSDDTWTPPQDGSIAQVPQQSATKPYQSQTSGLPTYQRSPSNYSPPPGQPPAAGQPPVSPSNMMQSLTQEDILFMRGWQRDSFYYRVIPMAIVGNSVLHFYSRSKGTPAKWWRYMIVSGAAFFAGKLSYRGELKRRLAETNLNTPFIQTLRKSLRIAPTYASEFQTGDVGMGGPGTMDLGYSQWESSNSARSDFASGAPIGSRGVAFQPSQSAFDRPESDYNYQPPGGLSTDSGKQGTSYDELRARNRGLIR